MVGGGVAPVRVVIADDVMLLRSGLTLLLRQAGVDVVAECGDGVGAAPRGARAHA